MPSPDPQLILKALAKRCAESERLVRWFEGDELGPDALTKDLMARAEVLRVHMARTLERFQTALSPADEQHGYALRGSTTGIPIPSILDIIATNRMTGTLRVTTPLETFAIEFLDGDVVHACSDFSREQQLLGSILVAQGKISPSTLEEFFRSHQPTTNARLGDALEHERLVTRDDLQDALAEQAQQLFNRLYAAKDSHFTFQVGERNQIEQRIRLNVTYVLLECARIDDEVRKQQADEAPPPAAEPEAADSPEILSLADDLVAIGEDGDDELDAAEVSATAGPES